MLLATSEQMSLGFEQTADLALCWHYEQPIQMKSSIPHELTAKLAIARVSFRQGAERRVELEYLALHELGTAVSSSLQSALAVRHHPPSDSSCHLSRHRNPVRSWSLDPSFEACPAKRPRWLGRVECLEDQAKTKGPGTFIVASDRILVGE